MSNPIEILLEISPPILIELDISPIYHVGTSQVGPKGADGREVEFQVQGTLLQWKYTNESQWNDLTDLTINNVDFETLAANGDIGTGADQVATGNHDHEIGNMALFFENKLI